MEVLQEITDMVVYKPLLFVQYNQTRSRMKQKIAISNILSMLCKKQICLENRGGECLASMRSLRIF